MLFPLVVVIINLFLHFNGVLCSSAICRFELRIRIALSADKLILIPRVRNTDSKAFSFTFALRNYLPVSDIRFTSLQYYLLCPFLKL